MIVTEFAKLAKANIDYKLQTQKSSVNTCIEIATSTISAKFTRVRNVHGLNPSYLAGLTNSDAYFQIDADVQVDIVSRLGTPFQTEIESGIVGHANLEQGFRVFAVNSPHLTKDADGNVLNTTYSCYVYEGPYGAEVINPNNNTRLFWLTDISK